MKSYYCENISKVLFLLFIPIMLWLSLIVLLVTILRGRDLWENNERFVTGESGEIFTG